MKWSDDAWQQSAPVYNRIIGMPFITELLAGTLDIEKFKFYMRQDAYYLEYFARTLAIIAAKIPGTDNMLQFMQFAEGAIVVERSLHDGYFKQYEVPENIEMSPVCHHYVHYLLGTVSMQPFYVGIAAVLPCFWIYKKVGDYILGNQTNKANPYQAWINTYAGEQFGILVSKAINICDEAAGNCTPVQQQQMTEAFITACRLEFNFWESAYNTATW